MIIVLQDHQETISSCPEGMAGTSPNTQKTKEKLKREEVGIERHEHVEQGQTMCNVCVNHQD